MESHRRTMVPATDPHGNIMRSGLPMPASAMKRSTTIQPPNPRMSLAGPAQRAPLAGPSKHPRQSLYASQNVNPLLQSAMKQHALGRTPLNSSTRRGSLWPGAPSMALKSTNIQPSKDTRPLRDKHYQAKERQDLINFLRDSSYEPMISMNVLMSIPAKDFRSIFDHLVSFLDPYYTFKQKGQAKFEEDFLAALRSLRYPFPVDAKNLAAPASMHAWPNLLGVLHWLVEMCKEKLHYIESAHPTLQMIDKVPVEFDDPHHHHTLHIDYYASAYDDYLSGSDDQEDQFQALENRYAKKSEKIITDLDALRDERDALRAEYEKITSTKPPIVELQESHKALLRDRSKFDEVIGHFESRKRKLLDAIAYEKQELVAKSIGLEQHRAEQARLEGVIRDQNLSPQEVTRMNTDHETLQRNLEDLRRKIEETNKQVHSLEIAVSNRTHRAETALDTYEQLLYRLTLHPRAPPPYDNTLLTLELNTAAERPKDLLIGDPDLKKGVIRKVLIEVANGKRNERIRLQDEHAVVENQIDELEQEIDASEQDASELERKVIGLNDQAERLREAAQEEAAKSSTEAVRVEHELANARNAALASGMGVKSRLQTLQIAYEEQIERVDRLRDELLREIMRNCNDIAEFKEEVSKSLDNLRLFAMED